VEPRTDGVDAVFFGAFVEIEDEEGARTTYRIVGEDEIDLDKGHISWRSPLGRSLLKKRPGDTVLLRRPSGEGELTILTVPYRATRRLDDRRGPGFGLHGGERSPTSGARGRDPAGVARAGASAAPALACGAARGSHALRAAPRADGSLLDGLRTI